MLLNSLACVDAVNEATVRNIIASSPGTSSPDVDRAYKSKVRALHAFIVLTGGPIGKSEWSDWFYGCTNNPRKPVWCSPPPFLNISLKVIAQRQSCRFQHFVV